MIASDIIAKASEIFSMLQVAQKKPCSTIFPKWNPPPEGCFMLNTDGSSIENPDRAGGGGVIRDHLGRWKIGCARRIGRASSVKAEIWALRDGLQLARENNLVPLYVQIDAQVVVHLINSPTPDLHEFYGLIFDCRKLMREMGVEKINHCFRESNKAADHMARIGVNLIGQAANFGDDWFRIFVKPPMDECNNLRNILYSDARGVTTPRLVRTFMSK